MADFLQHLQQRKLVQWALAYIAFAFALLQGIDIVAQRFAWPNSLERIFILVLAIGFFVALVLAWYHGERGAQRVSGTELLILALLLAIGGGLLWRLAPQSASVPSAQVVKAPAQPSAAIPAKSIAVLPFENLSHDKDNEYFADGMQDLILTKLAVIGDLKVISRTSTEKYASHPEDLKTIARQLAVATILEGSVQKSGNQVLINVQLIDAKTESHIWANSYQRTLDNIFGVEGEVAGKVAQALDAKLSGAESVSLAAVSTHDRAAMDLFLRAEYQASRADANYDIEGWKIAQGLYRQAIARDPDFALAYARVSLTESNLAWFTSNGEDSQRWAAQSQADAEQALKLAPNSAASHLAKGFSDYHAQLDFPGALKAFATALAINPNDSAALAGRGYVERQQGHYRDAIASLSAAFERDPRNSALAADLGETNSMLRHYAEAEDWSRRALAINPDNRIAKVVYAFAILNSTGDVAHALDVVQGDEPALILARARLNRLQRKYADALELVNSVSGSRHAMFGLTAAYKAQYQADLYRLIGNTAKAQPLFEQALAEAHRQLTLQQGVRKYRNQAFAWQTVADAELGLGHVDAGMRAIATAVSNSDKIILASARLNAWASTASLYAEANRTDLAVPLLAKLCATPGAGDVCSPTTLRLDHDWDPIRNDPRFQALLKQSGTTNTAAKN